MTLHGLFLCDIGMQVLASVYILCVIFQLDIASFCVYLCGIFQSDILLMAFCLPRKLLHLCDICIWPIIYILTLYTVV